MKTDLRNKYIPHSYYPKFIEHLFPNVLENKTNSMINVVSDIHILNGTFPFNNNSFNIFAGDLFDSKAYSNIDGIMVIEIMI